MSVEYLLTQHLDYVLLFFMRVSGLLIASPVFGRNNVPSISKIGFCGALTIVFIMSFPGPEAYPQYTDVFSYGMLVLLELLFGAAMGFVSTAMFNVVLTAGNIIDTQIGFSMVTVYDPQTNSQNSVSGNFFNIIMLLLFFGMDGHLRLIDILYATIEAVPVGYATASGEIAWVAAEVMSRSLVLSVMMSMPMIAAGMMIEIALGAIIRTVPQMNMFVVGIPLKTIIGLVVLLTTLSIFTSFARELTNEMFEFIGKMFDHIRSTL
ncbi:MAG: flagellar biosynthetic protein FliR [Oscillospiraceae bacterium]|nr:flagellar biosynthetic protein FliR [Oscillospiraceae bacterium]